MSLMVKSEESLECFKQLDVLSYEEAKSQKANWIWKQLSRITASRGSRGLVIYIKCNDTEKLSSRR